MNVQGPQLFSALHEELLLLKNVAEEGERADDIASCNLDILLDEHKIDYEEYKGLQRSINTNLEAKELATVETLSFKTRKMLSDLTQKWILKLASPDLVKQKGGKKEDLQLQQQQQTLSGQSNKPFSQVWLSQSGNYSPHVHLSLSPVQDVLVDENQPSTIIAYALTSSKYSHLSNLNRIRHLVLLFFVFF